MIVIVADELKDSFNKEIEKLPQPIQDQIEIGYEIYINSDIGDDDDFWDKIEDKPYWEINMKEEIDYFLSQFKHR